MNPIMLAAFHGLLKGFAVGPEGMRRAGLGETLLSAASEEVVYRGALSGLGGLGSGAAAALFAADHIVGERRIGPDAALRFGDVFLGGILYSQAFKSFGLVGAIAAHTAHNLACRFGQANSFGALKRRVKPSKKGRR